MEAKLPFPKFESTAEAAEYFDHHSVASVWDQLPEAKPAKVSAALLKKIQDRHAHAKAPTWTRLEQKQIGAVENIRRGS